MTNYVTSSLVKRYGMLFFHDMYEILISVDIFISIFWLPSSPSYSSSEVQKKHINTLNQSISEFQGGHKHFIHTALFIIIFIYINEFCRNLPAQNVYSWNSLWFICISSQTQNPMGSHSEVVFVCLKEQWIFHPCSSLKCNCGALFSNLLFLWLHRAFQQSCHTEFTFIIIHLAVSASVVSEKVLNCPLKPEG